MGGAVTAAARLDGLQGRWLVLRALRHADGTRATFRGEARWDGGTCEESGELRLGAAAMPARRATRWAAEGGRLLVRFEDGRPFHAVAGEAEHRCPPDLYRIGYDFALWPAAFACRWTVRGPRKDYRALTRYRRAG